MVPAKRQKLKGFWEAATAAGLVPAKRQKLKGLCEAATAADLDFVLRVGHCYIWGYFWLVLGWYFGNNLDFGLRFLVSFRSVGRRTEKYYNMGKKSPAQQDWKCPTCDDSTQWTWAKHDRCHICDRAQPKHPLRYAQTLAGKKAAKQHQQNAGAANDSSKEVEKLKADLAKANEKIKAASSSASSNKAKATDDDDADAAKSSSTAEQEAEIEALVEHAKQQAKSLKDRIDCKFFQRCAKELKEEIEVKRQQLRDSKDPHEQLRANTNRVSKLTAANKELFKKLAEKVGEEEAAAIAAAELRTKISESRSEIELLKSQTLKLADNQAWQTAAGMGEMIEKV